MDSTVLACWLRLASISLLSASDRFHLLNHFGSIESLFDASAARLNEAGFDGARLVQALADSEPAGLDPLQAWLAQADCHLLVWTDEAYPPLLREIPDPPLMLYVRGRPEILQWPQLAMVGSRNPTPGGIENAWRFAEALATAGIVVTSGMALGIDGASHRGALGAGGATVAVLGTGVDRVYPRAHQALAHEIARQGVLVSEFALGAPPLRDHFPRRNRIISGLTLGVLVVEATVRSGSLITARLAGEQGREVFAIPGSIHSPQSRGCHQLIRQGAKLVESVEHIVEELRGWTATVFSEPESPAPVPAGEQGEVLKAMGFDPVDVDLLVQRTGLTPDVISSMLTQMELHSLVAPCPGGRFVRVT